MSTAATIPYHLRPLKAIERNLFINLLKKLDRYSQIDLSKYFYVGFGAPFFEDFKLMHLEFSILNMNCIEYDNSAYSRQQFNNPYHFLTLFNGSCTDYISTKFIKNKNQIIWLDFASPKELRQQLLDIELTAARLQDLDILKLTFNAHIPANAYFMNCGKGEFSKMLKYLKNDATYQLYLPEKITTNDIAENFPAIIRAMAIRAIKRGLSKGEVNSDFNHLTSFNYADGQQMTTVTGIIANEEEFNAILKESNISNWEFYSAIPENEILPGNEILVPAMTLSERMEVDRLIPRNNIAKLARELKFSLDNSQEEHFKLIAGYCKYYKYLPYFTKVTF